MLAGGLLCLALGGALVGCGDEDGEPGSADDSAGTTPSPTADDGASQPAGSGLPACADIWVPGQDLPEKYAGCDEDGTDVAADKHPCSFGLPIVTYDGTYYAVPGAIVNEVPDLDSSAQYQRSLKKCQA
ncbi:hypothetical protein BH09ACT12_BH09ACT12_18480 [soil metagenome]